MRGEKKGAESRYPKARQALGAGAGGALDGVILSVPSCWGCGPVPKVGPDGLPRGAVVAAPWLAKPSRCGQREVCSWELPLPLVAPSPAARVSALPDA